MARIRLHKLLAQAGIASRRRCEELILEGHVTVDGVPVRSVGVSVDPETQDVRFDDDRIHAEKPAYYLVNKPAGVLSTSSDEFGRKTVISLVRDRQKRRLFTVGRLDEESEGLIIVTNDGEFANLIAHPRYGVEKTYRLKLHGFLDQDALDRARGGVWLSTGKTPAIFVKIERRSQLVTEVTVRLREGQNRVLRRIFAKVGHAVARLERVRIGSIQARGLKRGEVRVLTPAEIAGLKADVERGRAAASVLPRVKTVRTPKKPAGAQRPSLPKDERRAPAATKRPTRKKPAPKRGAPSRPATPKTPRRRR